MLLRDGSPNDVAVHFVREGVAGIEQITWSDLRERTRIARNAMITYGVKEGEKVAAVISNSVNAIVICLATLSIGAIWSSASCDLGAKAIVDRYGQIEPRLVFADNAYVYAGKTHKLESSIVQWSRELKKKSLGLFDVVILPYCDVAVEISKITRGITWDTFVERKSEEQLGFNHVPFSHPGFILFSSGTVGRS